MRNTAILIHMGVNLEMRTNWFDLWKTHQEYRCVVRNPRQAAKLNRLLERYPYETRFHEGEEPLFIFGEDELPQVSKILAHEPKSARKRGATRGEL